MLQRRTTQANELVISYLMLRKLVGWIGMLLPFVLLEATAVVAFGVSWFVKGTTIRPARLR